MTDDDTAVEPPKETGVVMGEHVFESNDAEGLSGFMEGGIAGVLCKFCAKPRHAAIHATEPPVTT